MASIRICSIAPESFKIKRSYNWNGIELPACPKDQPYSTVVIHDHTDMRIVAVDHWAEHSEKTPVTITAKEIVADFFANENLAQKGAFIPKGDVPTEEELANAHEARRNYLLKCVHDGQAEYSKSGRIDDIPGEWKRAAVELGLDFDWAKRMPPKMQECPACGEMLKPGVAICRGCGAILDREKARQFGLLQDEQKPRKREKTEEVAAA
jgi:ribosomal protein L32